MSQRSPDVFGAYREAARLLRLLEVTDHGQ